MKKCPTCEKTFEDSMKFCQVDGTPLVDDAPPVDDAPFDPFATIVGVAPPRQEAEAPSEAETSSAQPEEVSAISEPDDVLDLPEADPLRTMYVSDDEMKAALKSDDSIPEPAGEELPPSEDISSEETLAVESEPSAEEVERPSAMPEPEPPTFNEPDVPAPSFGDISPPPSPFSAGSAADTPMAAPSFEEPKTESKPFNEAETMIQGGYSNPFEDEPSAPVAEWTPPPAPEPSWENQSVGSNTPFQPPAVSPSGQNKTLAIVSLVMGILSILCCSSFFVVGIGAIVTGFMAKGKAASNPAEFSGRGLAIAGIVTGAISLLIGALYWILVLSGMITLPF